MRFQFACTKPLLNRVTNESSLLRLITAVLVEASEDWETADRGYLPAAGVMRA